MKYLIDIFFNQKSKKIVTQKKSIRSPRCEDVRNDDIGLLRRILFTSSLILICMKIRDEA